jgi:hypothetical protein
VNGFDDRSGTNLGFIHSGGGGDNGDCVDGIGGRWGGSAEIKGHDLIHGEVLRSENSVESFERERTFAIEEVGDVRLLKACLPSEAGSGKAAEFDTAKKLEAEKLV